MYHYTVLWKIEGRIFNEPSFSINWHHPLRQEEKVFILDIDKGLTFLGDKGGEEEERFELIKGHRVWKVEDLRHLINYSNSEQKVELVLSPLGPFD